MLRNRAVCTVVIASIIALQIAAIGTTGQYFAWEAYGSTPDQGTELDESYVKVALKRTGKTTQVLVTNNGEAPLNSISLQTPLGNIRFVKVMGWERERVDGSTVLLKADDEPLASQKSLTIIVWSDQQSPAFEWKVTDSSGNTSSGRVTDNSKNVQVKDNAYSLDSAKGDFRKALHNSIMAGGDFLLRVQNPDGSYKYEYNLKSNDFSQANNMLRQIGAVYSLLLLNEYSDEQKYLESAKKGASYFVKHVKHIDDDNAYIFHDDKAKLGGAALAVIALAKLETLERTGKYDDTIKDMTNFILRMQLDNGKFRSYYIYDGDYDSKLESHIYPGEAMLALIRAYKLFEDQRYLAALEKAYDYYNSAFAKDRKTEFTSWATTALVELYQVSSDKKYATFAFKMQDWLTSLQYIDDAPKEEYLGGYGTMKVPGIAASTRTEGVADAYLLAKQLGEEERAEKYKKSMLLACNFVMRLQFTKENTAQYENPSIALGAFYFQLGSSSARIDYTQHAVTAIIKTLTYLPPDEITLEPYLT